MKKSNLKVVKIGKTLFNYEKKILIKELTLDLKLGYYDFEILFFHSLLFIISGDCQFKL